jgi:TldD protein
VQDLLADLMDSARVRRAEYADARIVRSAHERLATRLGRIDSAAAAEEEGIGVRVRVGGAWGFAATSDVSPRGAEDALARALAVAEAQPRSAAAAPLAPEPQASGTWANPVERDPFEVSLEEKLDALLAADAAMRGDPRIAVSSAYFAAFREERALATTEGTSVVQRTVECGGGLHAIAVDESEAQSRSYPGSHGAGVGQGGFERFDPAELLRQAPRVAEEAVALLTAPACPAGRTTVILDGEQAALQLHESVGHAVELDRVLGSEASYAGTSFVDVADRGSLRYGSELMNVTADATVGGGLGTFGWDDEGVAAQAVPIVRAGVLAGFLSSRESAAAIGLERSGGCCRAEGFARQPIVRMTNVNLEPGSGGSLEDLIAGTDDGIYMETNRSWSIDGRRLHFQFATEAAWEVRDGTRGRLLRNPSYAGVTPRFWSGLEAVGSPEAWRLWSVIQCGKGEPGQTIHASHGTAPIRVRDVEVGTA